MASDKRRSKVPVAARTAEKAPTRIIAAHGLPPSFTRANAPGPRPSRARPNTTRGVTNRFPFREASTTSKASAAMNVPARLPKMAPATSPATRFELAMRSNGSTWRKAALSSK